MFSIAVALVFFVIAIVLFKKSFSMGDCSSCYEGKDYYRNLAFGWSIVSAVVGGAWLLGAIAIPYSSQITDFSSVR